MPRFRIATNVIVGAPLVLLAWGSWATVKPAAQSREADSAQALRDLVVEVRGLRTVVERYAEGHAQVQTLTNVLAIQQSRLAELNARLDVTRRELDGFVLEARRMSSQIESLERGSVPESRFQGATPAERRAQFEEMLGALKENLERLSAQEQQARTRETDLLNAFAIEEAKWNELQGRLDLWLKR